MLFSYVIKYKIIKNKNINNKQIEDISKIERLFLEIWIEKVKKKISEIK